MIYISEQNFLSLPMDEAENYISELLSQRPDFKKIYNRFSLGIYFVAQKITEEIRNKKNCNICVVVPASGPELEDFNKTHSESLSNLAENFKKIFSPKAHLYFTNSMVASQIAMDFQLEGIVTTLNDNGHSLDQLYSFLKLKLSANSSEQFIVAAFLDEYSAFCGMQVSGAKQDNFFAIDSIQSFISFYKEQK